MMKRLFYVYKESAIKLSETANGRALLSAIDCLEDELKSVKSLCREADEYLNTNSMTNIGNGSIIHQKLHDAGNQ